MTTALATPLRVLLIDDDPDIQVLTRAMLEADRAGEFQLDWASSYEQALTMLAEQRYDAALVDFWLGARTGEDLLRSEAFRNARVAGVMLTGDANPKLDASALQAGAVDYLVKSEVTPDALKRTLRYAVERQRVTTLLEQRAVSLRAILEDSTDVVMLLDAAGTILFASGSVRLVDGFDDNELVGRHVIDRVHDRVAGAAADSSIASNIATAPGATAKPSPSTVSANQPSRPLCSRIAT